MNQVISTNPNVRIFQLDNKNNITLKTVKCRTPVACTNCRSRKSQCSGTSPCAYCCDRQLNCVYKPRLSSKEKAKKAFKPSTTTKSDAKKLEKLPKHKTNDDEYYKSILQQVFPSYEFSPNKDTQPKHRVVEDLKAKFCLVSSGKEKTTGGKLNLIVELPPKDMAIKLVTKAWNFACILFRFYHRPTFLQTLISLYECSPISYSDEQQRALPLVYSVLACGALFSKEEVNSQEEQDIFEDEGYKYFMAASKLIDMSNVNEVFSIQAIYMLTLFLQNSAKLTISYSYIGTALRAVVRKGLHKKKKNEYQKNVLETEIEKRLFWTIFKTEIYMNCMLGLPSSLQETDVSQDFPIDIDDELLYPDAIGSQPVGKISSCRMNNEHTKLILILAHTKEKFYSLSNGHSMPSLNEVYTIEREIEQWILHLPEYLKPNNGSIPMEYVKANKMLHLDYLHVLIYLYKPFLQYIASPSYSTHYMIATKCIKACREVMTVSSFMLSNGLLSGSYWFSQHTIFFSIACLMYLKNIKQDDVHISEDRNTGLQTLYKLRKSSKASAHIFNELTKIFDIVDLESLLVSNNSDTQSHRLLSRKLGNTLSEGPIEDLDIAASEKLADLNNPDVKNSLSQSAGAFKEFLPETEELELDFLYLSSVFDQT